MPNAAVKLHALTWSDPPRRFYTTAVAEKEALLRIGFIDTPSSVNERLMVIPARNGACPIGMAPVRRLYNTPAQLHCYEINPATVSVLTANGYVDENIAFCSPPVQ